MDLHGELQYQFTSFRYVFNIFLPIEVCLFYILVSKRLPNVAAVIYHVDELVANRLVSNPLATKQTQT